MKGYKVLVVDDSAFMRKLISDLIAEEPLLEVIGVAKNGAEAIAKVRELEPDVITMDIEMPVMNGLDALKEIMSKHPTPVVMLSSVTMLDAEETILALEYGAIDFIRKPSGEISVDLYKIKALLLERLLVAAQTNVTVRRFPLSHGSISGSTVAAERTSLVQRQREDFTDLVAIGTSTGGPRALQKVLSSLPKHFPAPLLIVQHMPPNFTKSLAQRLNVLSELKVVEAEQGMTVTPGTAYIAPGGWHMRLERGNKKKYSIALSKEEPRNGHRPSVDTMFESLLSLPELNRHIVLMTGMGSDGAKAMKQLHDSGVRTTIAESEETCVVYGMPKVAVELQAADLVLPADDIPHKLMELVR